MSTVAEKIKDAAQNSRLIYSKGVSDGFAEGFADGRNEGIDEGRQAEYDAFWDVFQKNGVRDDYLYAFASCGWTQNLFKPKYGICASDARYMFQNSSITDIRKSTTDTEITFAPGCLFDYFLNDSSVVHAGVVDMSEAGSGYLVFRNARKLETVEKLILPLDASSASINHWRSAFLNCSSLREITIEGTFDKALSFKYSTRLSRASIESIFAALSDSTSNLTVTISSVAVSAAFETSEGAGDGSESAAWTDLIATKPNWTIAYN